MHSLESALVVTVCLLLLMAFVVAACFFLLHLDDQGYLYGRINDGMERHGYLYRIDRLSSSREQAPYVEASPLRALLGLRLAEDLLHLKERRQTVPLAPLPQLPGQEPSRPQPPPQPSPYLPQPSFPQIFPPQAMGQAPSSLYREGAGND